MDWGIPAALAGEPDDWAAYWWCGVADLARAAGQLAALATAEFFSSLEPFLTARRFLPAASMARAMVEHAVVLDHLGHLLTGEHLSWLAEEEPSPPPDFPIDLVLPLWQTVAGGRYPWDSDDVALDAKQLKKAEERLLPGQKAKNILTLMEKAEKRGAVGIKQTYSRLCDCVHPSRGSRELLFSGIVHVEEQEVGRLYAATSPSEAAGTERAVRLVGPAVVSTDGLVQRYQAEFIPTMNRLGIWSRSAIKDRGYHLADLGLGPRLRTGEELLE